jgi:hypothetical protein
LAYSSFTLFLFFPIVTMMQLYVDPDPPVTCIACVADVVVDARAFPERA